jgi:GNAT superfamily N-acetyltransferase
MIENVDKPDLPAVRELITASLCAGVVSTTEDLQFVLREIDQTLKWWVEHQLYCIHRKFAVDGTIYGIVLVKHFWNISCLFVAPERQRTGIGRALMLDVLTTCKNHAPARCLKLHSSTVAVPFYQSLGFRPYGSPRKLPGGCVPLVYDF